MSINITVADSLQYQEELRATLNTTTLTLEKIPLNIGYTATANLILEKIPLNIGYTATADLILEKIPLIIAYNIVTTSGIDIEVGDYFSFIDSSAIAIPILINAESLIEFSDVADVVSAVALIIETDDVTPWVTSDLNTYDESSAGIGILIDIADTISKTDNIKLILSVLLKLYDTISTNDAIQFLFGNILKVYSIRLCSDFALVRNNLFYNYNDTISHTDFVNTTTGYITSDTLPLSDTVQLNLHAVANLQITSADYYLLADTMSHSIIYSDDYIRRYLNDRLFKLGDVFLVKNENFSLADSIYLELN